jgi:hypothetical protein
LLRQAESLRRTAELCRRLKNELADISALGYALYLSAHHNKQMRLAGALERWSRGFHERVLMAWCGLVSRRAETKHVMTKIVLRLRHRELCAAVDLWVSACAESRESRRHRAAAQRRLEACTRSVRRMLLQRLSRAWNAFADLVMVAKDRRHVARRVVGRLSHMCVVRAFARWVESVLTWGALRKKALAALARWARSGLLSAFSMWADYIDLQRGEREHSALQVAQQQLLAAAEENGRAAEFQVQRRLEVSNSKERELC